MADSVNVTVRDSSGRVSCDPDLVVLYPTRPGSPTGVVWSLETATTSQRLEIRWEGKCPFGTMRTGPDGRRVEGLENLGEMGEYPYTAVVTGEDGGTERVDPKIVNRPWP